MHKLKAYLHNSLVAIDQALNVIVCFGLPGETISAHSQRAADKGNKLGKFMVWWLDKLQANHGKRAEQGDLNRAKAVEQTEEQALK